MSDAVTRRCDICGSLAYATAPCTKPTESALERHKVAALEAIARSLRRLVQMNTPGEEVER